MNKYLIIYTVFFTAISVYIGIMSESIVDTLTFGGVILGSQVLPFWIVLLFRKKDNFQKTKIAAILYSIVIIGLIVAVGVSQMSWSLSFYEDITFSIFIEELFDLHIFWGILVMIVLINLFAFKVVQKEDTILGLSNMILGTAFVTFIVICAELFFWIAPQIPSV